MERVPSIGRDPFDHYMGMMDPYAPIVASWLSRSLYTLPLCLEVSMFISKWEKAAGDDPEYPYDLDKACRHPPEDDVVWNGPPFYYGVNNVSGKPNIANSQLNRHENYRGCTKPSAKLVLALEPSVFEFYFLVIEF